MYTLFTTTLPRRRLPCVPLARVYTSIRYKPTVLTIDQFPLRLPRHSITHDTFYNVQISVVQSRVSRVRVPQDSGFVPQCLFKKKKGVRGGSSVGRLARPWVYLAETMCSNTTFELLYSVANHVINRLSDDPIRFRASTAGEHFCRV